MLDGTTSASRFAAAAISAGLFLPTTRRAEVFCCSGEVAAIFISSSELESKEMTPADGFKDDHILKRENRRAKGLDGSKLRS